jgi:ABC-type multidrug transport system ATPase subunit
LFVFNLQLKFLFLIKESTAGLDIKSRRIIYKIINELKKDRIILVCTHLMEEVESIADKIAIFTRGEIKTVGSCQQLKKLFGDGFNIRIIVKDNFKNNNEIDQAFELNDNNFINNNNGSNSNMNDNNNNINNEKEEEKEEENILTLEDKINKVKQLISEIYKGNYYLVNESSGQLIFNFPNTKIKKLLPLIDQIEKFTIKSDQNEMIKNNNNNNNNKKVKNQNKLLLISDWSISETTLEEVYLKVNNIANNELLNQS